MKVGIITFHWGANHGAMLQAYASAKYLQSKNVQVQIIDYYPKNQELTLLNALKPSHPRVMLDRFSAYKKEQRVAPFRKKLPLTKRYYTNKELMENPPDFDVLLTGSDQVWNPYFIMHGEGQNVTTPVYFLNFGKENCKKIALSVSFGCSEYPEKAGSIAKPLIGKFDYISVRENTGLKILEDMGVFNGVVVADPTSLLTTQEVLELCESVPIRNNSFVVKCILRKQNAETKELISNLMSAKNMGNAVDIEKNSMENWLANIRDSAFVVTNSFHCVMMCLKLHTPFVVVTESGIKAGMNDRLFTLLQHFSLTDLIVGDNNIDYNFVVNKEIDWDFVDNQMAIYAKSLADFLDISVFGENANE